MDSSLKQRLVGAAVLVALAVIFLPMLVKGPAPDSGVTDVPLDVPAEPKPQGDMQSVDLPLVGPGAAPANGATGMPVPAQDAPLDASAQGGLFPAVAAGDYAVSFGSYATAADADKVIAALRSAELPAFRETVSANGRQAQRVRIGPFADRAVAEAARLRAVHVNDKVDAKVVALDAKAEAAPSVAAAPAPAKVEPVPAPKPAAPVPAPKPVAVTPPKTETPVATPKPEPKPEPKPADTSKTGFVVQVGAFADAAAATALRDKLRGAGFNAFTDVVNTDAGKRTRVRVGPAMNRTEADQLKASVQSRLGIAGMVRPHP